MKEQEKSLYKNEKIAFTSICLFFTFYVFNSFLFLVTNISDYSHNNYIFYVSLFFFLNVSIVSFLIRVRKKELLLKEISYYLLYSIYVLFGVVLVHYLFNEEIISVFTPVNP